MTQAIREIVIKAQKTEQARDLDILDLFKCIHLRLLKSQSKLFTCYSVLNIRAIPTFPTSTSEILILFKCATSPHPFLCYFYCSYA